jgi:hypothetical protein
MATPMFKRLLGLRLRNSSCIETGIGIQVVHALMSELRRERTEFSNNNNASLQIEKLKL